VTRCLVVGAGTRGIVAATLLRKADHEVIVADGGELPGGILCSEEWDGLYLDKGCHLLDFADAAAGNFFQEILGDAILPVQRRYASINRGIKSDGIAVPDLSQFPQEVRRKALREIKIRIGLPENDCDDLAEKLAGRFGETAGNYAGECVKRISAYEPDELAPEAFQTLRVVHRLRLGTDSEMEDLKSDPSLDERLAVSSQTDPLRFYRHATPFKHRNFYPSVKGMRGFCEAAAGYLEQIGVDLRLSSRLKCVDVNSGVTAITDEGDSIEAEMCYWSLPASLFLRTIGVNDPLSAHGRRVSMLFYYFRLPPASVGKYTYVHDFTADRLCFRSSAPGIYGQQTDAEGNTYVCAEVPVRTGSELWEAPEKATDQIWEELKLAGQVHDTAHYAAVRVDRLPVAFILAGKGWAEARVAQQEALVPYRDFVRFTDSGTFGKTAIINAVASDLSSLVH